MATVVEGLLTAVEFGKLPEDGVPKELIRGRVVPMNIPAPRRGQICAKIIRVLSRFLDTHDIGHLISNDSGVITEQNPDTVRGADVVYCSYERIPRGPLPAGYLSVVPELVFEVLSPTDRWREVRAKTNEYLAAGVTTVCVLNPVAQTIHVYCNDLPDRILEADQDLTLPETLGDFRSPVKLFFE
jgi:Uma2 family endonuclease